MAATDPNSLSRESHYFVDEDDEDNDDDDDEGQERSGPSAAKPCGNKDTRVSQNTHG